MEDLPYNLLKRRCGAGCMMLSAALWVGTTVCSVGCWDTVAAITLFPYWSWALLGCTLSHLAARLCKERWMLILVAVWTTTALCFSDNLVPMLRLLQGESSLGSKDCSKLLRVVTLNCAGHSTAAAELGDLKPDIVLLQEIPSTNDLARLTHEWFGENGSFVAGLDCAILARGPLKPAGKRFPPQYVQAVLPLSNGGTVLVTSLRLVPPQGRLDLWNPAAWSASAANRRLRRAQLQAALERDGPQRDLPEILGGDFNAPVPDAVFGLLTGFTDGHAQAGRGWGNTAINSLPIARPDQIWLKQLNALSVRARRTTNSDHRLVVADVALSR